MEFLEQERISPALLDGVRAYRAQYPAEPALQGRIPQPRYHYYGKEVWEAAIAALLCGENLLLAGSKATGMTLVLVDGGKYKDLIAARMRKSNGQGSWMVFDGIDDEYAEQVTAEHKLTVRSNGRDVERWVKKTTHADNHYLDCEVYAAAAADVMGVRSLYPDESGTAQPKQITPPSTSSEENWISENEEWI